LSKDALIVLANNLSRCLSSFI